ncbi:MAG: type II toxin-antitoxin system VapB family antitoxin [Methylococcaceae bacterium]|nr:type II toxin-antitoxin system VapB family antitoxin [Methylococcaceae bacterium]
MTIQLAIDDALINEVCVLGHFETQEDAVINALREFINHRKQQEITDADLEQACGILTAPVAVSLVDMDAAIKSRGGKL